MKVFLFHPVLLPPKDYGGVERVVQWLAKGLLERGHQVWIGALEGSSVPKGAQLVPFNPSRRSAWDCVKALPDGIDIVHFMAPPEPGVVEELENSYLLTIHGNARPGESFPKHTVFLTQDHARRHGRADFVYNGLDPDEFNFNPKTQRERWLFLSKTQWSVKNLRGAIALCDQAGVSLTIAGGWRPHLLRWRIALQRRHHWVGPVAAHTKAKVLSEAKGLVFPVLWPEPFGLVVVEALLSGAPVLATPMGSLPELVPKHVGALIPIEDTEAWVEWLSKERLPFEPEACRAWALEHFHYQKMAERYEQAYLRVIKRA